MSCALGRWSSARTVLRGAGGSAQSQPDADDWPGEHSDGRRVAVNARRSVSVVLRWRDLMPVLRGRPCVLTVVMTVAVMVAVAVCGSVSRTAERSSHRPMAVTRRSPPTGSQSPAQRVEDPSTRAASGRGLGPRNSRSPDTSTSTSSIPSKHEPVPERCVGQHDQHRHGPQSTTTATARV